MNNTENKIESQHPLQGAGGLIIREAIQTDCPRLMELVHELALYEKAPDEVTVTLQHFEETGFGPNPVWKAFVAEVDGLVVGFALYYVRYSTWKGSRMYLEDLIVTEDMRGKKIGKLLFDRLIQEAKERGFSGMVWQVLDWNEPAINFYNKYGANIEAGWLNASLSKEQLLNY
ncbi:GNAT family N-acetyltransferase [Mucilaginibacter rubeus]|uniref:GNAT family N-acetyltransferase n=1 Tax=Mucilaginibacter rubeus TaxID=2027860 RepID=A0AAE6MIN3_9SPHI|nr:MULTISPECIES: GNAT family N-acetyltransferase [Mucilaginibacter]QEM04758.1 GNAT family N-acetyltransferase [Mucilaginibacter rubeus]QEM17352.1 GNAT family N-acetyltransferase [Mucilaginibacter gossypii]QTE46133.1 GNAT family N-acetyltransferase [Mucilaginibacter rubeus]QTE52731.1 GNAT family N-acetyltransferase [Mucilaginibacter rubeus]QTE57818.1 GNAT family N-acetyltransferase [Mucilaginibacter rubeus]